MTGHSIRVENMESIGNFNGVIIEESLENIGVLENVAIISTRVEPVTEKHKAPWLSRWILHSVEVEAGEADKIADEIQESLTVSIRVRGTPVSRMNRTSTLFSPKRYFWSIDVVLNSTTMQNTMVYLLEFRSIRSIFIRQWESGNG